MFRKTSVALALVSIAAVPLAAQTATAKRDPAFEAKLINAFEADPTLFLRIATRAQEAQRIAQAAEQNARIGDVRPVLLARKPFGPVVGNPAAGNTVVELLDYQCSYCKRAHGLVSKIAKEDRTVRFVIVMRPVLGPDSEVMARFALASDLQGKFEKTHDAMYETFGNSRTKPVDDNLRIVAAKAGLDFERAKRDMTGDAVMKVLAEHTRIADRMGVNGTPFFVTASTVIPGAPSDEDALKKAISAR